MKTLHTKSLPVPCAAWANRLAALHPADLAPDERADLKNHIASCAACAAVYTAYQEVDARILSLPIVQPSTQQVAQLERMITDQTHDNPRWKPAVNTRERLPLPVRAPTRLARLERRGSLLAAALIVMVLAGSAFALFSSRHASNLGAAGTRGIVYSVSSNDGTVYATDTTNGKTIWSTPLHTKPSEQFLVSGGKIFLGSSDHHLYALQANDGHLLWKRSYKNLTTMGNQTVDIAPYPASDGKTLYIGATTGIYAWRASDGRQLWSYPAPKTCSQQPGGCAPEVETVNNGTVYAYLDGLYALNATNGSMRWHDLKVTDTRLVVAQNHVYVSSYDGQTMHVLQAETGRLLNMPGLPRIIPDDMLTDGKMVYLRSRASGTSSDVYAIRGSDNSVLWHKHYSEVISLLDTRDGSLHYEYITVPVSTSNQHFSQVRPVTNKLLSGGQKPIDIPIHVCSISTADGSPRWCLQAPAVVGLVSPAAVSQEILYARGDTGLYAIHVRDGKILWHVLGNTWLASAAFA